jgi:RHS repeat-associated protein
MSARASHSQSNRTKYGYDEVGNLIPVTDPLGGITEMDYDEVDRVIERRLPNGVVTKWDYDLRDRPILIEHRNSGGTLLASVAYVRGLSGEPTRITREDGSYVELSYDPAWRIAGERYYAPGGVLQEEIGYDYDTDGNRIQRGSSTEGDEVYGYGQDFELDAVTSPAGAASYTHDLGGRLTSVTRAGRTLSLGYDSDDHVTSSTNSTTGETTTYAHDAFGREREATGTAGALPAELGGDVRYHGQWQDAETGLYHVRARTYDSGTARFASRDPVEGAGEEPETFHPYTWNANNPHVFRDPTGLVNLMSLQIGQAIQATLLNVRAGIARFAIQELKGRAIDTATDIALDVLTDVLLPAGAEDLFDESSKDVGDVFEKFVETGVCDLLERNRVAKEEVNLVWLKSGVPASSGYNCSDRKNPPPTKGFGHLLSPEAIVKRGSPKDQSNPAFFVAEVKWSVRTAVKKWSKKPDRQMAAILNYAKRFTYGRTAVLITLRGGRSSDRAKLRRLTQPFAVNLVVISVRR